MAGWVGRVRRKKPRLKGRESWKRRGGKRRERVASHRRCWPLGECKINRLLCSPSFSPLLWRARETERAGLGGFFHVAVVCCCLQDCVEDRRSPIPSGYADIALPACWKARNRSARARGQGRYPSGKQGKQSASARPHSRKRNAGLLRRCRNVGITSERASDRVSVHNLRARVHWSAITRRYLGGRIRGAKRAGEDDVRVARARTVAPSVHVSSRDRRLHSAANRCGFIFISEKARSLEHSRVINGDSLNLMSP